MQIPKAELHALVRKTIARIRGEMLTRNQKAREIRLIRRTVRWGK